MRTNKLHVLSVMEALLVTFLWSSSYVLVKIGLVKNLPLTFVSMRYIIASLILIPIAFKKRKSGFSHGTKSLLKMVFLGFSGYTVGQGLQCVGLFLLPATSVTFILNFTPVMVMALGVMFLNEIPTYFQFGGMVIALLGAYFFFGTILSNSLMGIMITLLAGLGWAFYLVFSRRLFVKEKVDPLSLTAFSMGFGTAFVAVSAYFAEGALSVSFSSWVIILWLSVVNTAFAFFLWNHALQRLGAFEISILQNTMLVQIALLSWFFLGELLTTTKIVSMFVVFLGVLLVQLKK